MCISKCLKSSYQLLFFGFLLAWTASVTVSCQNPSESSGLARDSVQINNAVIAAPSLQSGFLDYYVKAGIPIVIKPISAKVEMNRSGFKTNFSPGQYDEKDSLFIFSDIVSRNATAAKVIISIPSEGLDGTFYLRKENSRWKTIADSTEISEK